MQDMMSEVQGQEIPEMTEGTGEVIATTDPSDIGVEEVAVPKDTTPNIVLSKELKEQGLAEGVTNVGMKSFALPSVEEQLQGFYVEDPGVFVGQFRQYKFLVRKGEDVPSIVI